VSAPTDGVQAVFDADASLVFVCYDDRGSRTVNPVETALIETLATTVAGHHSTAYDHDQHRSDGGLTVGPLGEGPPESDPAEVGTASASEQTDATADTGAQAHPSVGVVTPHNAQRGALTQVLPPTHTANTVEKYQGGGGRWGAGCGAGAPPPRRTVSAEPTSASGCNLAGATADRRGL